MPDVKRVEALMDAFRRIVHALRTSHRAAAYLNLTGAQLFVINTLHGAQRPMSVSELAARTHTDPSTVSVVVGRLVRRGLVQRSRASDDARRAELTLTRRGQALQRKAPGTVAQEHLADALESLTPRDAVTLRRVLGQIVTAMGEEEAPVEMLFSEPLHNRRRSR